jgi:hypothetical protein
MAYEIAAIAGETPPRDGWAWEELDGRLEAASGPPSEALRAFLNEIMRREPCSIPLESEPPFWLEDPSGGMAGEAAHWRFSHDLAEAGMTVILDAARAFQLTVFDMTALLIHRPDGLKGFALTVEDIGTLVAPTAAQIDEQLQEAGAEPEGFSCFGVLDGPSGGYLQWLGGGGVFTVERREARDDAATHFVARRWSDDGKAPLPASSAPALAHLDEGGRLSLDEARELLADFLGGKGRSARFDWRPVELPPP